MPIPTKKQLEDKEQTTPEPVSEDSAIASKLAELEEALKKTRALNESIEKKEKELDERLAVPPVLPALSPEEAEKQAKALLHVAKVHEDKSRRMKEHLAKQPRVKIFVPLEGKEKPGTQLPVTMNGYRMNIPKGVYCEVPEQVAQIIMDSLNQTEAATNIPQRLDLSNEQKKKALGFDE